MAFPGCAKGTRNNKVDQALWDKVWKLISDQDAFEAALQERIAALQAQEIDAGAECDKLQKQLDELAVERQAIITWARKGVITESGLAMQLGGLEIQERGLKRELDMSLLVGSKAERLMELARLYREDVQRGAVVLTGDPLTDDERRLQFEFRRKIIQGIVKRVNVRADKTISVEVELTFDEATLPEDVSCIKDVPSRVQYITNGHHLSFGSRATRKPEKHTEYPFRVYGHATCHR